MQLGILPPDQKPSSTHSTPLKRSAAPPSTSLWNTTTSDPMTALGGVGGGSMDLSASHTDEDPLFGGPALFTATKRPGSAGSATGGTTGAGTGSAGSRPGSSGGGTGTAGSVTGIAAVNISTISTANTNANNSINTSMVHNTSRPGSASSKLNTTSYLGSQHMMKASEIEVSRGLYYIYTVDREMKHNDFVCLFVLLG